MHDPIMPPRHHVWQHRPSWEHFGNALRTNSADLDLTGEHWLVTISGVMGSNVYVVSLNGSGMRVDVKGDIGP